jgi:hypothetical protein
MGFCLDHENGPIVSDYEMINVPVLELDIIQNGEMIHRQPLQNPLHFSLGLCRPGLSTDKQPPFPSGLHARMIISGLKYFAVNVVELFVLPKD